MSLPHFDFDRPTIAGDAHDDDAEVLNRLVESHAEPPTPEQEPKAPYHVLHKPKPITRLMSGWINVDKSWPVPTQILPADPNRKSLRITVMSSTSTDVVQVSDEQNRAQSTSAALVPVYAGGLDLSGYTGPVWIFAPNAAGIVTVSFVAVTA